MGYRALVADDEFIIRRGIIRFLSKFEDIEDIAEAEDGEMALEIAEQNPLDILFVDINMPFLNGFQFIEQLKKIRPGAVVVVITGYNDFEYARQAIRLGVSEYILKPLMEDVFDAVVIKILKVMDKNNEDKKYFKWAQNTLKKNRPNLVADFIKKWMAGQLSIEETKERMEYLEIRLQGSFAITLIHLEYLEKIDTKDKWEEDLLYYATENIASEIYGEETPISICRSLQGNLVFLGEIHNKKIIESRNQHYVSTLEKCLPVKAILVQEIDTNIQNVPDTYHKLLKNMEDIKGSPNVIKDIKIYIELNYKKEYLSLLDVAQQVNLSPQHLSRVFKKEMGITFVDYLTKVRIKRAIALFDNSDLKMYEIAEMVGYSTQHYFSSVFKKALGVSPIEYRKSQISSKENRLSF